MTLEPTPEPPTGSCRAEKDSTQPRPIPYHVQRCAKPSHQTSSFPRHLFLYSDKASDIAQNERTACNEAGWSESRLGDVRAGRTCVTDEEGPQPEACAASGPIITTTSEESYGHGNDGSAVRLSNSLVDPKENSDESKHHSEEPDRPPKAFEEEHYESRARQPDEEALNLFQRDEDWDRC
ncbi:hypothetical protein BJ508DRAFT_332404 [Ascobolus immersus RN42]|uniref:Uncharacterized protein n=1 Tax=Ascobolus immersus RN42 TaxID=1160509 RepID=A0A3N4HTJ4_ASCIM|nr:hypothetical protein BJ508DRAFT_332404 [Ascobolus immersus RN42]